MKKRIKILHLEDNPTDALLVQSMLEKSKINFEYFFSDNEKEYHSHLENHKIDIILSDYHLPDYTGNEALVLAREKYPDIPFIFISGTMGEEAAIESLLNGATDYVLKNKMERLGSAVTRAINEANEHKARKIAEQEVLKLSRAVEQSPSSILITDTEGIIEYVNSNVETSTGYSKEELIGNNPRLFSSGKTPIEEYTRLWGVIASGNVWRGELCNKKKNGEIYWENASISPIINGENRIINYLGIKTDITEYKQLTLDLIAAKEKAEESDRLKSAFLANMSHEIRTPMNGILGFAELLKTQGLTGSQQQEYIRIIEKSGARMLNIINDIVDISKIESGQMKVSVSETNINDQTIFVNSFFKPQTDAKGITLKWKNGLPVSEALIRTDKEKIYAILTNLVKNAIKYTDSGFIEFGYTLKPISSSKQEAGTHELEYYVKDTGIGVPADRIQAIFDRFIQADISDKRAFQGAGLGLAIAKAYAEMLGGRIWVESEEGKGSTFYFTIPYNPVLTLKPKIDTPISKTAEENQIKPLKILIAEDDETSEMLLRIAIGIYSNEVLEASTGVEAVEICRQNPDIDLILMDIKMPVMDGYEATKLIRQFNKDVIIIAQTAYGRRGDEEIAIAAGCDYYIAKPLDIFVLKELIQKHFLEKK